MYKLSTLDIFDIRYVNEILENLSIYFDELVVRLMNLKIKIDMDFFMHYEPLHLVCYPICLNLEELETRCCIQNTSNT